MYPWRKVGDDLFCSTECFHFFSHKNYIASLEKKIKELEAKQAPAPKPVPQPCVKCKKTDIGGVTSKLGDGFYCTNCFIVVEKTYYDPRFRAADAKQCLNCKLAAADYFIGSGFGVKYCTDCYDLTLKPKKTPKTVTPTAGYFNPDTHVIVPRKELLFHPLFGTASFSTEVIASQLHDDKPAACPPESSGCDSTPAQKPKTPGCLCKAGPPACPP